ncbi:hypothetical protein K458DRAFT_397148 [Lentithecium fluviatile CBS 122367]|uniref:Uncharacterized protein n=1 Tax=Lentithecium fluviatile CBS 122367 TaxID=1168545 RepID=A0A6G1IDH3_9PLEO|nr:hypothetical protein K458DRAFT_397148 [Lentithecium fluviatile CBS 122367]
MRHSMAYGHHLVNKMLKGEYLNSTERITTKAYLPILTIHIYCSPCTCLIHSALSICSKLKKELEIEADLLEITIRPDDRLASSCCAAFDRTLGLKSIIDVVHRRLDHFEFEEPYAYKESGEAHAVILGGADYLHALLQKAPGTTPRASQIWDFKVSKDPLPTFTRELRCRFTGKKRRTGMAQQRVPLVLEREDTSSKRTSPSILSETKRHQSVMGAEHWRSVEAEKISTSVDGSTTDSLYD